MLRLKGESFTRSGLERIQKVLIQGVLVVPQLLMVEENPEYAVFDLCTNRLGFISKGVDPETELRLRDSRVEKLFALVAEFLKEVFESVDEASNISIRRLTFSNQGRSTDSR